LNSTEHAKTFTGKHNLEEIDFNETRT